MTPPCRLISIDKPGVLRCSRTVDREILRVWVGHYGEQIRKSSDHIWRTSDTELNWPDVCFFVCKKCDIVCN